MWNAPARRAGPPPTMRRGLLTAKRTHLPDAPLPQSTSPAKPPLRPQARQGSILIVAKGIYHCRWTLPKIPPRVKCGTRRRNTSAANLLSFAVVSLARTSN